MLPEEQRDLIMLVGRHHYYKMKDLKLPLTRESGQEYLDKLDKEKRLKKKMGYRDYNKMKELNLSYEEYKQYVKEQKLRKYELKKEKNKTRYKTIRYIERYCNLEMKCQICGTDEDVQIHHPNYNDYLKINLLCREHHTQLHNFELVPPPIIDLEKIKITAIPSQVLKKYIEDNINKMKEDVLINGFTYARLKNKYNISVKTIKSYFLKDEDYARLKEILEINAKKVNILKKTSNRKNPLLEYKLKNNLTTKELSTIVNISIPTLRAIESGRTNFENIHFKTKRKLQKIL